MNFSSEILSRMREDFEEGFRPTAAEGLNLIKEIEEIRDKLEAAVKYIADSEGDWDMAGRFLP